MVAAIGQLGWALRTRAGIRRHPPRDASSGVVDLRPLSANDWEVVGPEPKFILDATRIPTGWVRVRGRCVLGNLPGLTPTLRIVGASDQNPYVVRLGRRGLEAIDHVLAVPEGVQSLELVVVPGAGTVRLEGLELSRISRPGATAFMLRAVVRDLRGYSRHRQAELARNIIRRLFRQGPRATMRGLGRRYSSRGKLIVADPGSVPYLDWLRAFDPVGEKDRLRAIEAIDRLTERSLVSIIMPVYDTDEVWLRKAIDSVRAQWYGQWELCIADDASTAPHVSTVLAEYSEIDPRIRSMRRSENGHISAASNSALELATGEWVALLDHDDVLSPHALATMVLTASQFPDVEVLFSDEDKIDEAGVRYDPHFKPPWNPDLFLSQNYLSHLGMYRHRLVREVGGFREGYEGSQDYDLALRCVARLDARQVKHVPFVLYSWRSVPGSTARSLGTKSYAEEAAIRAIRDHLGRRGIAADVDLSLAPSTYRVRYELVDPAPPVEVIVPTRDGAAHLQACLEGLTSKTRYPDLRVQVVDNGSTDAATLEVLEAFGRRPDVVVVADDRPFNFAALNNAAVGRTTRPIICLLNDDIEVVDPDWLTEMVSQVSRPGVGVVGAMLRYPDGAVQHAGVVLGAGGVAAHAHAGHDTPDQGYFSRLATVHEVGAVTGACLVTTRASWEIAGGMDEALEVNFNDVDYCLRVAEAGQMVLWTPHAVLLHLESKSRGHVEDEAKIDQLRVEAARMVERWGDRLFEDPAYGPNLTLEGSPFGLSDQPRFLPPWWVPES
jgi:GT2 family glycosyltransferase